MKKFFTFAITALAMIAVFSSCKKEEYTDEALINNIATNALYTGKCVWNYSDGAKEEDKVAVTFTSTNALGKVAVVTFESGMLSGDGVWDVKSAVLSLSWKGVISKQKPTGCKQSVNNRRILTNSEFPNDYQYRAENGAVPMRRNH
ncbi:MAG: hypothetical protein IKS58_00345, partial [Paludibacteraceae bacterium]|nr:hypothetical protein [Paludibacteraceae bacterium]